MKRSAVLKPKIDWDTVELIDQRFTHQHLVPEQRGRSMVKQVLSGAAAKARARGSIHTHTQLRKLIPAGIETLIYGWWLVAAAIESDRDISRGVELAARAIRETSARLARVAGAW